MTARISPATGFITGASGSTGNRLVLTPEQRALAASGQHAWILADKIVQFTNSPDGGNYFTKWKLNATAGMMHVAHLGTALDLWQKDPVKDYWRHRPMTWTWCMTALALRDEWDKSEEAQKLREFIAPRLASPGMSPPNTTLS